MTTYCQDCRHVYRVNEKDKPKWWLCQKHKRSETQMGFVTREFWDDAPPYLYCHQVNAGYCPLFEELQPGQMKLIGEDHG